MRWIVACALLCVAAAQTAAAEVVYDFGTGVLPHGATLLRASPAVGAGGAIVPVDTPRFVGDMVVSGARVVASFDSNRRVMAQRDVGGTGYTLVWDYWLPALTTGQPGIDPAPAYVHPHPSLRSRFGADGTTWGNPGAGEILPDGTVLLHTRGAGAERRSLTLRTTVERFAAEDAFDVVRVSDYAPPPDRQPSYVLTYFTRTTYLPNQRRWVSTIAEYDAQGPVSSVDPAVGRALGYASTDSGRTWVRVVDTDVDGLGRGLVPKPIHLHHLEPLEWFDASAAAWKIGAIALVGDGPTGCATFVLRSNGADFPDPEAGERPSVFMPKGVGESCLTDIFPVGPNGAPGDSPTYIAGTDGGTSHQSGMWSMSFQPALETDVPHFQPTVGFLKGANGTLVHNTQPFVFQLARLGNGALVAPGWWGGNNGIWVSQGRGTRWTTAYLPGHAGFRGALPVGDGLFWTRSEVGNGVTELFSTPAPASRQALLLGARARELLVDPVFSAALVSVTDEPGQAPPTELPPDTPVQRIRSTARNAGDVFSTGVPQLVAAAPGEFVHLVYWLKPARADLRLARFDARIDLQLADGRLVAGAAAPNDVGMNGWTRFVMPVAVTGATATTATPILTLREDATPARPLDYYVTKPQLVVSQQPTVQAYRSGFLTGPDRLSIAPGTLGGSWSVAIWGTEAMSWFVSYFAPTGTWASVQPSRLVGEAVFLGRGTGLRLTTSNGRTLGASTPRDVYFPTQDLVVLTRSAADNRLTAYVSRGMGELDVITGPGGSGFDLAELRFESGSGDRTFEGTVHRVVVWNGMALDRAAVEAQRTGTQWVAPAAPSCGLGAEAVALLLALRALRSVRRR